ncbi:hypothetical protein [Haliangium sp.]|uniref:hypothetical protein n=1 Tax=Haliangium sp. TaxID=2663208 RepID=UPI003D0BC10D
MATRDGLRLVGTPGTNKVMHAELLRLAWRGLSLRPPEPRKAGTGTLIYPFDPALAWLAVRYHRTATRALWDLYESRAARLEPLYEDLLEDVAADHRGWAWDGARISVQVRNVGAFPAGERQIVGTVKNALIDGARARGVRLDVDPRAPDIHVAVRMHDDALSVSLDLAGASLSQRGYRARHGHAPLREHLAAVLLMLARHDPRRTLLLDPMCGAGTICIEAALLARAAPLAPERVPACARLPAFAALRDQATGDPDLFPATESLVIGNDIDARALSAARANARAAGVTCAWLRGDFRTVTPAAIEPELTRWRERVESGADPARSGRGGRADPPGLILSNPPYGHRLDDREVLPLYRDLGHWCDQFPGWRAAFLVGHPGFEAAFGRRPRVRKPLNNGSLRAFFLLYEL